MKNEKMSVPTPKEEIRKDIQEGIETFKSKNPDDFQKKYPHTNDASTVEAFILQGYSKWTEEQAKEMKDLIKKESEILPKVKDIIEKHLPDLKKDLSYFGGGENVDGSEEVYQARWDSVEEENHQIRNFEYWRTEGEKEGGGFLFVDGKRYNYRENADGSIDVGPFLSY